jgi:DNA-directed RNA polymerase specialized sigma24 family protein
VVFGHASGRLLRVSQANLGIRRHGDARPIAIESGALRQPPERRLAFVLCEIEGVSAADAARILDTTETAVWKRVSDVRRALRALSKEPKP